MYVRPQGYSARERVQIPRNYSGSVFREQLDDVEEQTAEAEAPAAEEISEEPAPAQDTEALLKIQSPAPHSLLSSGGIGSEELLLLALIFLLSDSDIGDELILFLVLLFFIK